MTGRRKLIGFTFRKKKKKKNEIKERKEIKAGGK